MRESTLRLLEEMQVNEKTDSEIYAILARRVGGENGEVLHRMAADEARHCEVWGRYTKKPAEAKRFKVLFYSVISWIFGLTFVINLLDLSRTCRKPGASWRKRNVTSAGWPKWWTRSD